MRWLWIAALLTGCGGGSSMALKPSLPPLTEFILQDPKTYTNGVPIGPIESRTLHCGSQSGRYSLAMPIENRLPAGSVTLPNGTVFCAASVIVASVPSDYSNEVRLQCQGGRCVLR